MTEALLLARIVAAPRDDGARLVLGDLLADSGDPRGELIHVQCTLASGPGTPALRARERELLPLASARWHAALGLPRGVEVTLRRGMVEHVTLPSRGHGRILPRLATVPLAGITFSGGETADAVALFGDPILGRFSELGFVNLPLGRNGLAAFASCPHLGKLRALRMARNGVGAAGARTLFASKAAPALEELTLEDNGLHSEGFAALVGGPWVKSLNVLSLHRVNVNTGWQPLGRSLALRNLRELHLGSAGVFQPGNFLCQTIAASSVLSGLAALTVAGHSVETAGLKHLTTARHSTPSRVDLSRNIIGPQAVEAFASSPFASKIALLDLSSNKLGDRGAKALLSPGVLPNVAELRLAQNGISDAMVAELRARYGDALVVDEPSASSRRATKKPGPRR